MRSVWITWIFNVLAFGKAYKIVLGYLFSTYLSTYSVYLSFYLAYFYSLLTFSSLFVVYLIFYIWALGFLFGYVAFDFLVSLVFFGSYYICNLSISYKDYKSFN